MRVFLRNVYYSLPIQLLLLHIRKYQVLLLFWYLLFATVAGSFMKLFGADALFFSPEYLGSVNFSGAFLTGLALGVFFMSWNITTFILHSRRLKFLATTPDPFLRYCINNSLLPLIFLVFYFVRLSAFAHERELMSSGEIATEIAGIFCGTVLLVLFSFMYFFGAGKTIERSMKPVLSSPALFNKTFTGRELQHDPAALNVQWYLSARFRLRKTRDVSHYRRDFLEAIFKRHHLAAILSMLIAFLLLIVSGYLLDYKIFAIPAAASTLTVFALLIAVIGALTYFMESWSLVTVIAILAVLNFLFSKQIIDPRNKAYGLNYEDIRTRPAYNKAALEAMAEPANVRADRANMLTILERWKNNQRSAKPLMVFINVSGGGLRSAAFTMNALQQTDSLSGGNLMKKTVLISGASGGMLAAAYYRELYREKENGLPLNIYDRGYTDAIARDLLNPIFTSLMARDIFAPFQKFTAGNFRYVKDRAYAFEEKLNENTGGVLDRTIGDMQADEYNARIPLMIFNTVIKTDARKMLIGTQPMRFMMKPAGDSSATADAVDFCSLFHGLQPDRLRLLTALRMNATFPYVLPNVWLPTDPVIDVMDAGLRDNYGQETTLRFIDNFRDWIKANTSGVLLLELRDRLNDNWQQPFETKSITDMVVTPATMLQHNLFKLQDYSREDQLSYFSSGAGFPITTATIMYMPAKADETAELNFHLSAGEKRDVVRSFSDPVNARAVRQIAVLLQSR